MIFIFLRLTWIIPSFKSTWYLEFTGYVWKSSKIILIQVYEWRLQVGVIPFGNIANKARAEILLPVLITLSSADLEALVSKGWMVLLVDTTMISLNWKMRLPPDYFWLLMILNWQIKRGGETFLLGWLIQSINVS